MANRTNVARQAGVLPVSAANVKDQAGTSQKSGRGKAPIEGQKIVIRRLPPGISEEEVLKYLEDEWQPNKGKVGWFSFMPGKTSNDPSKPSRPSRAYLHLLRTEYVMPLMDQVRSAQWEDANGTCSDPCLCGPPAMEMSIYKKIPTSKNRADARQGTIDQDPEFMAFLESLANPTGDKDPETDHVGQEEEQPIVKASSTPLIDYLREKKANKSKDTSVARSGKHSRHDSQPSKNKGSEDSKRKSREAKTEKSTDRPRQNVKILTKKAATAAAVEAANNVASQISASSKDDASAKGGRRAGIAAAARILARDLGISPGNAHRKVRLARQEVEKAESDGKLANAEDAPATKDAKDDAPGNSATTANTNTARQAAPAASKPAAGSSRGPRGKRGASGTTENAQEATEKKGRSRRGAADKPSEASASAPKAPMAILKRKDDAASGNSNPATVPAPSTANTQAGPTVPKSAPTGPKAAQGKGGSGSGPKKATATSGNSNTTRAFVKHANPSQGVTDAVLKEAMQVFGNVTFVEIDRRKGFAYVDFANHEGLAKAIAASPVTVAQATVQVLERKDTNKKAPPAASTGNTGSSKGNTASGSAPAAPKAPGGPKIEAETPAASGSTAASAEKPAGEHKRGGRRRGGRGRGGDTNKDGSGGKGTGGGNKATSGGSGNLPVPASSGS
ncbi:hypothetical protein MGG_03912 [Pyricularia oryzae 70-15]|uniref:RRM domain-containing protein n=3 Tax=Pyricularia oryzae TaxID=318829 RepID=G4NH83_PYRO7|nr:uncharacterized protein MGG_03912 [Pyricularia oryzae 70-15]EHA47593.1 hypothetical protein MGG_03912 [Pyricularia oryzae 70-15]ELQ39739.1 hypothetical protein OOU_Y34scaffold00487g84 [Pyricularia oryzae Y34]KAI7931884.1 hypothetical protein M0657_000898 [Pyricularia oryzae]